MNMHANVFSINFVENVTASSKNRNQSVDKMSCTIRDVIIHLSYEAY